MSRFAVKIVIHIYESKYLENLEIKEKMYYGADLAIDPVDLAILVLQLASHIDRHISQVTDHRINLAHIFLHFAFTSVSCNFCNVATLGSKPIAFVHHSLGLIVHHLSVVVSFPRTFIFFEARTSLNIKKSLIPISNFNYFIDFTIILVYSNL